MIASVPLVLTFVKVLAARRYFGDGLRYLAYWHLAYWRAEQGDVPFIVRILPVAGRQALLADIDPSLDIV
jgi:hypothetical protein